MTLRGVSRRTEKGKNMRPRSERAVLREDVATLLSELGGTADEVALSLTSLGVPVEPSHPGDSPVARYLHAVVGADDRVKRITVTKRRLLVKTNRRWWSTIRLRLPCSVRELAMSVDAARPNRRPTSRMTASQLRGDRPSGVFIGTEASIWPHLGRF
jgi:hypothetical protein